MGDVKLPSGPFNSLYPVFPKQAVTNESHFDIIGPMETTQASFSHSLRENAMGGARKDALRIDFDRRLKVEFHGTTVTSDAGGRAVERSSVTGHPEIKALIWVILTVLRAGVSGYGVRWRISD